MEKEKIKQEMIKIRKEVRRSYKIINESTNRVREIMKKAQLNMIELEKLL